MLSRHFSVWFLVLFLFACTFVFTASAQVPEQINYQGRLVDGTKLVNDTVTMKLSLFKSETGGDSSFEDTNTVIVVDGLYSTYIGEDTAPGALKDALSVGAVWLEVEVDGTTLTPREALASAGYSQISGAVEARGVTSSMLDSNVVTSAKILDHTITGDDIQFETISSSYLANNAVYSQKIEDGTILNVDINSNAAIAASKIADGPGSGLDADTLDGLGSANFLRSDASCNFMGGVLTIITGSTLNVNGALYTEHLSIGYDSATDDDAIYFDRNAESFLWDEGEAYFRLSDDLLIGTSTSDDGEALFFDSGLERLYWNDSSNRFQVSADLLIGGNTTSLDDTIFFDAGGKKMMWDNFLGIFSFSDDLVIGTSGTNTDEFLYFEGSTEWLQWDVSEKRFALSDDLLIGTATTPNDNEALYFDNGSARILWDDASARFDFNHHVSLPLSGTHSYYLYLGGQPIYLDAFSAAQKFVMSTNLQVNGSITKQAGSFRIDHPLDPENKYLYHSFVESPDMKNIYDGVVVLDAAGGAEVEMPEWFEALNKDFRYQLTAIGAPGPNLYIAQEVAGNRFGIGGGTEGMKVSWQVTGIRQDAYANANRIPVEEDKPEQAGEAQ